MNTKTTSGKSKEYCSKQFLQTCEHLKEAEQEIKTAMELMQSQNSRAIIAEAKIKTALQIINEFPKMELNVSYYKYTEETHPVRLWLERLRLLFIKKEKDER